jgi:Ca2+-binding EF-hand superfamily protein
MKRDTEMYKIRREQKDAVAKAYEIFAACDSNGDGSLAKDEFLQSLREPSTQQYLHDVGIDLTDAEGLFDILDHDRSGVLSVGEFVDGCIRARGGARAKEMMMLHCDIVKMFKKVTNDVSAMLECTPLAVEQPWGKGSDGEGPNGAKSEPNGAKSAPEIQVDPAGQAELRARVEGSISKAESTLAEVKRRVGSELDALEAKISSSADKRIQSARAVPGSLANTKIAQTALPGGVLYEPPADELRDPDSGDVDDLIRGSKTLDDLLNDVETEIISGGVQ